MKMIKLISGYTTLCTKFSPISLRLKFINSLKDLHAHLKEVSGLYQNIMIRFDAAMYKKKDGTPFSVKKNNDRCWLLFPVD